MAQPEPCILRKRTGILFGPGSGPADGGKGIGNVLFFSLCQELKNMGAEYMTIFVTETNFARRIYEKAGFSVVQEWAILKKTV